MKHSNLILAAAMALAFSGPSFAQRPHPSPSPGGRPSNSGGPPADRGPGSGPAMGGSRDSAPAPRTNISHASPSDVLSHNTALAGKVQTLTGQDAQTACGGFKNIGQCVAAAHVAKNLDIPGGFDALKGRLTGDGAVSLGKAIQQLAPQANAKAEAKKANKQASDDLREMGS